MNQRVHTEACGLSPEGVEALEGWGSVPALTQAQLNGLDTTGFSKS